VVRPRSCVIIKRLFNQVVTGNVTKLPRSLSSGMYDKGIAALKGLRWLGARNRVRSSDVDSRSLVTAS
jgi:hypothetical protein